MRLILDRINKDSNDKRVFAFETDNGIIIVKEDDLSKEIADKLFENIIINAEYLDGKLLNVELLLEETKEREETMKKRFASLLNKRKK